MAIILIPSKYIGENISKMLSINADEFRKPWMAMEKIWPGILLASIPGFGVYGLLIKILIRIFYIMTNTTIYSKHDDKARALNILDGQMSLLLRQWLNSVIYGRSSQSNSLLFTDGLYRLSPLLFLHEGIYNFSIFPTLHWFYGPCAMHHHLYSPN